MCHAANRFRTAALASAILLWAGVLDPGLLGAGLPAAADDPLPTSSQVAYQLPPEGPWPKAYRVTLAVVDPRNPDWIISQFVAGAPRTVTAENGGRFVETWDGLDDNFMPVPPGTYAVRGIYMPARRWAADGEYHSVTPRFVAGASAWMPRPEQWRRPEPFGGDPCGAPLGDVAVGPNGLAVFYYVYLENGLNNPRIDLKRPVGYEQLVEAFGSGGAAGGTSTATDGTSVWSFSTDGGPKFVYRADQKPFGTGSGQRRDVYRPAGWVTSMAAWREPAAGRSYVAIAQRGKIVEGPPGDFRESPREFVDKVAILAGQTGEVLAEVPLRRPQGLAIHDAALYALHAARGGRWAVSRMPLAAGRPQGPWTPVFLVPDDIQPQDVKLDSRHRIYLSDAAANRVCQFDPQGRLLRSIGRLAVQKPGSYDRLSFIAPGKLATWTDAAGTDRLLMVEHGGPNRVSEWSAEGELLREFLSLQTKANDGYAIDPQHPEDVYIAGHQGWLTRFTLDYDRAAWTIDAVWPEVGTDPKAPGFDHPQFVRVGGRSYLACGRSYNVYRQEGDRWLLSAAIIREQKAGPPRYFLWHDAHGDGRVREDEYRASPIDLPGHVLRYHGEQWLADLSLAAMDQAGTSVWRLAPEGFDRHGNPIFKSWRKLLSDPVFVARAEGKADTVHGGNELDERFSSDWAMTDGTLEEGFYVTARGGYSFSANEGAQTKVSRYVPDGRGGYRLKWRTGRQAMQGVARPGEIYGAIHLRRPINGLLSVIDQSRCGVVLYTEEGLYVDSIFPDGRRHSPPEAGIYTQPGEFFAGSVFPHEKRGKIYFAMGKYTPLLYEAEGWTLEENPVRPLTSLSPTVKITAAQIADPPEIALSVRGGAGVARLARFAPALGGAVLSGSLAGWESCDPVRFQSDKDQTVEVRCLYDPEHLYLRWHARLAGRFRPRPLEPVGRIFTHDRLADTLSFYLQGDPAASPGGPPGGRPGDVRIVLGIFQDGQQVRPVALGMIPHRGSTEPPGEPQVYGSPTGRVEFAQVGLLPQVKLAHVLDQDGKGFVLVAAIPRTAIPPMPPLAGGLRTMVNFSATFGGHNKFWWANADGSANRETYDEPSEARLYPGSWAAAQFQGLDAGVLVRRWLICGPWGGPGAEQFHEDLGLPGEKERARQLFEAAGYPPDDGRVDPAAVFKGPAGRGYWPSAGEVRWRTAATADLDTRVVLGPAAQVWYGATWIHVPDDTELEFRFQGHPQTYLRFYLNGAAVLRGEIAGDAGPPVARKNLKLRQGWNQVMFRGYCTGYPPFRAGLLLAGPPQKLWTLRLSATPPETR